VNTRWNSWAIPIAATPADERWPAGPLRLSEDRRTLETIDGDPFFWLGDTAWYIVWKGTPDQWMTYLDRRVAQGFSVVHVILLPYESGDLRRSENQVMGAAVRTRQGNAAAYVFYRRVQAEADRYEVSAALVLACAIAHELDRPEEADSAHVADAWADARFALHHR
jgi:hypothetical protein